MDLKSLDAANAYGQIAKQATGPGLDAPTKGAGGASFADLVQDVIENTVSATSKSEETTALALNKQAELLVVTAVNSAEMAVETVVAVRDKVVEAYNEIMRMPL